MQAFVIDTLRCVPTCSLMQIAFALKVNVDGVLVAENFSPLGKQ